MKIKLFITLSLFGVTSLFAQTTMCYKENHKSMLTIDKVPLDGGLCNSQKSLKDMKSEGWSVNDIKIEKTDSGNNFIYILKKTETVNPNSEVDMAKLEERILQRIEKNREIEKAKNLEKAKTAMIENGKKLYESKCQSCHGVNADLEPYNIARPLIDFDLIEFESKMTEYKRVSASTPSVMVMKPYAISVDTKKIREIYSYIKTLKEKAE